MRRNQGIAWLAAIAFGGGMLLSGGDAAAQGFRWPWESPKDKKEKTEQEKPGDRGRLGEILGEDREDLRTAKGDREQFIQRLYDVSNEQLRLSERAVREADNDRVRQFARQMVRDHRAWNKTLEERAQKLGFDLQEERQPVAGIDLPERRTAEFDIAYLDALMENVDGIRSDFAEFKAQTRDDEFHAELSEMFNEDLVEHRDQAKELHDNLRNQARDRGIIE